MNEQLKKYSSNAILTKKGYTLKKEDIDKKDIILIKKLLTVKPVVNKQFAAAAQSFPVFYENKSKLYLPRFWAVDNIGKPSKTVLKKGDKIDTKCVLKPRENQIPIIKKIKSDLKEKGGSIISVGCGCGKTAISLYLSSLFKQKTLIVVHTSVLLNQWIERIEQFIPGARIGKIQGKKFEVENKDYVIAMLQTLSSGKYTRDDFNSFGFCCVDEIHHIAAPTFSRALPLISTKYTLGLSATPKRPDKLEKVFEWYIGNYGWIDTTVEDRYAIIKSICFSSDTYEVIENYNGSINLAKMLERIVYNENRNHMIIHQLQTLSQIGRQILVLSNRKKQLQILKESFDELETINSKTGELITSDYYVGGLKKEVLDIASRKNVIFGTYQLIAEGTDIPTLNTLVMASPRKFVEQVVGRIFRAKTEFIPLVIDIADNYSIYKNQGLLRKRYYKKNGFHTDTFNIIDELYNPNFRIKNTEESAKKIKKLAKKKKTSKSKNIKSLCLIDED